jgi:hypothetical protein
MGQAQKSTVPKELRDALLKIAVETDVISEHRGVDSWRVSAVTAARWLLRAAALAPDIPRHMQQAVRSVADLARRMNAGSKGSGEYVRTVPGEPSADEDEEEV